MKSVCFQFESATGRSGAAHVSAETEREHAIGSGRPYVRALGTCEVSVLADPARMEVDFLPPWFMDWFHGRGWTPRRHQLEMVQQAREGKDVLLIAPTGGGKTLAGFLPSLIDMADRPPRNDPAPPGIHTLYISPLKALAVDVARNLMQPIAEMGLAVTV